MIQYAAFEVVIVKGNRKNRRKSVIVFTGEDDVRVTSKRDYTTAEVKKKQNPKSFQCVYKESDATFQRIERERD